MAPVSVTLNDLEVIRRLNVTSPAQNFLATIWPLIEILRSLASYCSVLHKKYQHTARTRKVNGVKMFYKHMFVMCLPSTICFKHWYKYYILGKSNFSQCWPAVYVTVSVSRLSFTNLSLSDSGEYECLATNRAGNVSRSVTLTVSTDGRDGVSYCFIYLRTFYVPLSFTLIFFLVDATYFWSRDEYINAVLVSLTWMKS